MKEQSDSVSECIQFNKPCGLSDCRIALGKRCSHRRKLSFDFSFKSLGKTMTQKAKSPHDTHILFLWLVEKRIDQITRAVQHSTLNDG